MPDQRLTRPVPPSIANWRTCPVCSESLEALQEEEGAQPHLHCGSCGERIYANPRPTSSLLALDPDGRLLLVRRSIEPFKGLWDLPGGFLEDREDPRDGAQRELEEETGLTAELGDLFQIVVDLYGDNGASTLNLFYSATVADPSTGAPSSDIAELRWCAPDEVPPTDEIAFEGVRVVVRAWLDAHRA